ncbi:MAG: hypothetical protein SFV15_14495 [Polyangiaceae bacterium]|nr:hypothetical protein [Polyangiaceae bacterium]
MSSAVFGDAGATLYVAHGGGGIAHYDTVSGRELRAVSAPLGRDGLRDTRRSLALSTNGKLVADVGVASVLFRESASLEISKNVSVSEVCVPRGPARFSPSGKYLLLDGAVPCVVNAQSGAVVPLPDSGAFGFAMNDEVLLLAGSMGIRATSPDALGTLPAPQLNVGPIEKAISSPDGRYVAFVQTSVDPNTQEKTFWLHLAQVDVGSVLWVKALNNEQPFAFAQNSTHMVISNEVYAVEDGSLVKTLPVEARGQVEVSDNEQFALVLEEFLGRADSVVRLVPLAGVGASRLLGVPAGSITALAMDAKGTALVSGGAENLAWSLASERAEPVLIWMAGGGLTTVPDVSADGSLAAIAGDGGALIDMRTGLNVQTASIVASVSGFGNAVLNQMRFSPNGRLVAGAEYGLGASVRSVPSLQQVALLKTQDKFPAAVFSPDSEWVYTSTPEKFRTDGTLAWGSANGIDPELWPSRWAELSDKGDVLLVSGCSERDAAPCLSRLYSAADGSVLLDLPLAGHRPRLSKEGDWVLADGELFHTKTREVRSFNAFATASVFTPSGDIFAGHADGSLTRYCRSSL